MLDELADSQWFSEIACSGYHRIKIRPRDN